MQEKLNIEEMCYSYRLLYEIETRMRSFIDENMRKEHGYLWYRKRHFLTFDFHSARYYQLVQIIRKFPQLKSKFSNDEINKITSLTDIRNKICHMRELDYEEFELLTSCHAIIVNQTKELVEVFS
ncbi:hypothetical protein ACLM5H_05030 [Fredinandcohnia humi]